MLTVAKADLAGYKALARVQIFRKRGRYWSAPSLANGRVYCRSSKGTLVCRDHRALR